MNLNYLFLLTEVKILPYFLNQPVYVDHPDPFFKSELDNKHSLKYTGKNASHTRNFRANWLEILEIN